MEPWHRNGSLGFLPVLPSLFSRRLVHSAFEGNSSCPGYSFSSPKRSSRDCEEVKGITVRSRTKGRLAVNGAKGNVDEATLQTGRRQPLRGGRGCGPRKVTQRRVNKTCNT